MGEQVIVHITGTQCAGKTYVIDKLIAELDLSAALFDMEQFWRKHAVIEGERFDVSKCQQKMHLLVPAVHEFVGQHKNKDVLFFESSGINKSMNNALYRYEKLEFVLPTPDTAELKRRAKLRGFKNNKVAGFGRMYRRAMSTSKNHPPVREYDEIKHEILAAVEKGRQNDKDRSSTSV